MAALILVTIGSGNWLAHIQNQAITRTNGDALSTLRNKFQWNLNEYIVIFMQENV